ncbi:MAG: hypothetical protein R3250_12320 [Melioribacteraceae bacterium]|nr:hypothetical protein [Melioribacteraceae bacterium]
MKNKILGFLAGLQFYGFQLPVRIIRLLGHPIRLINYLRKEEWKNALWWLPELVFYVMDCLAVPEIYDGIVNLFKTELRPLNELETEACTKIFGSSLIYSNIRIDEHSRFGPKQHHFVYVSFYTINSFGKMPLYILIHEVMHVWQFHHFGSVYILKALRAQHSKEKYNYGGLSNLYELAHSGQWFYDLNFEQQGDLVADYFLLSNGKSTQWSRATYLDLKVFNYFIQQIQHPKKVYLV